jgi:hypothetical protein
LFSVLCFVVFGAGGKAFEQPEFSSGILMLPPRAKKQLEEANNNEIFYVVRVYASLHMCATTVSAFGQ